MMWKGGTENSLPVWGRGLQYMSMTDNLDPRLNKAPVNSTVTEIYEWYFQ